MARSRARLAGRCILRDLTVLVGYIAAGIIVTWPLATHLADGTLPYSRDVATYVWDFWWMAHQVAHLGNPWFTRAIAAPAGSQLGYDALMPLEGVLLLPVTFVFGPVVSYNLLSILLPGLLCYSMYRAARLWLPSQTGAIAAGAMFGLCTNFCWQSWYHMNVAVGVVFLPMALEAAVRLRRDPGLWRAVILGAVVAASLLSDQQSAVLAAILAALALLPWLLGYHAPSGGPSPVRRLMLAAAALAAALVVSSPQIAAMVAQARSGGAALTPNVDIDYAMSGINLRWLFSASPRVVQLGLTGLSGISFHGASLDGLPTFGVMLTLLAIAGLALSWRRSSARLLALLFVASAALTLGSVLRIGSYVFIPDLQVWHGVHLSGIMPFTWFVQLPGLAGFREAGRIFALGMVPAALLGGAAVDWLRHHALVLLVPVLVAAALEVGWSGSSNQGGLIPAALPRLDNPIAADHSGSIVVDVPFGVRGGIPQPDEGAAFDPHAQVLATQDGHPRAVAYLSRVPAGTFAAVMKNAFYAGLLVAQGSQPLAAAEKRTGASSLDGLLAAARLDARQIHVGWVIVWQQSAAISSYLAATGFRPAYAADGARIYRPGS